MGKRFVYSLDGSDLATVPQFNWSILNYGHTLNNVRVQDALFRPAAVTYQQTVPSANAEAENAVNRFLKAQEAWVQTHNP